ncbi:MAG: ABC transporter ATP-binding protein [Salinivirgaceae bacterium]|nr:ABC transporter ATP-binding protein [Salinivirgaceae bacterium]MBO7595163.1 ABC transporter ATP-binding protein [Salinivirgaceae bacterium]
MKSLKRILKYIFPQYWKQTLLNFLFIGLSVIAGLFSFTLVIPFLQVLFDESISQPELVSFDWTIDSISAIFNYYLVQIITIYGRITALFYISVLVLVAIFLKTFFWFASKLVMVNLRYGIVRDLRNKLYNKITRLSLDYYSDERKGDVISRMTNDVNEVETSVLRSLDIIFKDPITLIMSLGVLIYMSPKLTLFVLVMLPISGGIVGKIGSTLKRTSSEVQGRLGSLLSLIEETLGGLRIVKSFNAHDRVFAHFNNENQLFIRASKKMMRRRELAGPLSEFLGSVILVVVLWFGGQLVLGGKSDLTSPQLIGYLVIFSQMISPAKQFIDAWYGIQKGLASSDRIDDILNAKITIQDCQNPKDIKEFKSEIEYRNVSFKYTNDMVLKDINLTIKKGQTVALVGQSGSGKSTMVDLLPRFYDVVDGGIYVDGTNIKDLKIVDLRHLMGIVGQESILFNDTIFNNIAFGVEHATMDQVIEAAKIANAHEFIMETPDGYQSNIGDRGGKLSGGQRQRISIARAILANPPIMILDEATSALDTESEKLVQDALFRLMENRTSIVIAHRLSTVVNADLICVLQDGKIIERGTHAELMALGGQYKKLHDIQTFA